MTPAQKLIVAAYRYLAIAVLGAVLSTALAYAAVTLFYTVNTSWTAPLVISRTHEKILRLTAEVVRTRQAADSLEAAAAALTRESDSIREQEQVLQGLVTSTSHAAAQQRDADLQLAMKMAQLDRAKQADIAKTRQVLADIAPLEEAIKRDLQAGLVTRDDAAKMRATLNTYKTSATDATVAGVTLERQLSDLQRSARTLAGGPALMPQAVDVLARVAAFRMQLEEARLKRQQNTLEIEAKQREAQQLRAIIATLTDSPYYRVTQSEVPLSFAFVPYENEAAARPGQPVFDCLLHLVVCRQAGTVLRVHHDEERAQHPLFRVDTRGFLVELNLTDPQAAKSRVLFIGRAPILL